MNPIELKDYLKEDPNRIVDLLESIGFHSFKTLNNEIRCALPNGDNPTSVRIKLKSLSVRVFTHAQTKGDIYTLIGEHKELNFPKTIRFIHDFFKIKYTYYNKTFNEEDKKPNVLNMYKSIRKNTEQLYCVDIEEVPDYILNRYDRVNHIDFINDGIIPQVMDRFDIRFADEWNRILIPHYKWDTGELVGIFGRTVIKDYEKYKINKYIGVAPYLKTNNLYGLSHNYESIQKEGFVIVCESEKAVLQAQSFGINNVVALCCAEISPIQRRILFSLNVAIVLGFDKGITIQHIETQCKQFKGLRPVYYMWDEDNLLKDKDSPTDNGLMIYNYLIDNKVKYEYKGETK